MLDYRLRCLELFTNCPCLNGVQICLVSILMMLFIIRNLAVSLLEAGMMCLTISKTFERLGIPNAERQFLSGAVAQYESEVVYHNMKEEFEKMGIIFTDTDTALQEYPDLMKKYFASVVSPAEHKFAALNGAVWSGGTFIYVPKGVQCQIPVQTYFRINGENAGQFERSLMIIEEGASIQYIEGCTAPTYSTNSLHARLLKLLSKRDASFRYTTIQNWSDNVYNLVTEKRHGRKRTEPRMD